MKQNRKIVVGALVIACFLFSVNPVVADWSTTYIGGGSMKRNLYNIDCSGFGEYVDILTPTHWYRNILDTKNFTWDIFQTGWNKEIWNGEYQVGHPNIAKFIDGQRVGFINNDRWPDMVVGTVGTDWPVLPPVNMRNSIYVAINCPYQFMMDDPDDWAFYYVGTLPATSDGVETVSIADVDNDECGDIFAGGECHELRLYKNSGKMDNNWDYTTIHTFDGTIWWFMENGWIKTTNHDVEGTATADFNNDGYMDVAVITADKYANCGEICVFQNPGVWNDSWQKIDLGNTSTSHHLSSCIESITVGDLNNDGFCDIVGVNQNGEIAALWWIENINGNEWYSISIIDMIADVPLRGHCPEVGDFDGDGDLDIAVGTQKYGGTYWYENNAGTWPKHKITSSILHRMAVGDVFNDGKDEIVANGILYTNQN